VPDILMVDGIGSLGGRFRTCKKSHRKFKGRGKNRRFAGCRKGGWVYHRRGKAKARRSTGRRMAFNPNKICRFGAPVAGGSRRGRCPTKAEMMRRARRIFKQTTGMSAPRGASLVQMSVMAQQAGVNLEKAANREMRARLHEIAEVRAAQAASAAASQPRVYANAPMSWAERQARERRAAQAASAVHGFRY
jgi:hypothetical protein